MLGPYGYDDLIFDRCNAYAADYGLVVPVIPPVVPPCTDDCCPPGGGPGGSGPGNGFGGGCGRACRPAPSMPAVPASRGFESSSHPVRYVNGEVELTVDDLQVGGFGVSWGHKRTYTNQATLNHDYGNGYNWSVPQWAHVIDLGGDGSTVVAVLGAAESYWFDLVDGAYVARFGATVELQHVGNLYRFHRTDGTVWEFFDYQPDYGCPAGALKSVVTAGGNAVQLYYQGSFGPLSMAIRSGADADGQFVQETIEYGYFPSGPNAGRLQHVTLRRQIGWSIVKSLRRVEYAYYDGAEIGGSLGDLKTVCYQHPDLLGGWTDGETHYYRYWAESETGGFEHGLKYVLGAGAFARLAADPEVIDPLTTDDEKVAEYADHYFEYGERDRVVKEAVEGGSRTIEFSYTEGTHAEGFNHWKRRTVESRSDGSQTIVYTNFLGQVLLKELRSPGGGESWIEHRRYDDAGRVVEIATPAAVEGYMDDAGPGENELVVTLRADRGLIRTYAYHDGQSGPVGYLRSEGIRRGESGDEIVLKEYEYTEHSGGGRTVYPLARQVVYREEDGSGPIETTVSYTWYPNSVQVQEQVTTLPAVPVEQNGPGTSATFTHRFDSKGSLQWERDERGFITYHEYDATSGGRIRTIRDVDATRLAVPSGWSTPTGGGLHVISDFQYDQLGRLTQTLGPEHEIDGRSVRRAAWTVYKDLEHEVWTAQGYQSEPGNLGYGSYGPDDDFTLVNPVTIRKFDFAGRVLEEIQAVRAWTEGALSASDSFEQSAYVRWTTHHYDQHGRLVATRAYHTIPSSGEGTAEANYNETNFGFDAMGRQNMVKSPGGTITRTVFDFQGNPVAVYVGTDDTGATNADPTGGGAMGNNMVLVSEYEYAGPGGCTGCCGGGAGLVTAQIQYIDDVTSRVTEFLYDWRNRRQYVIHEADDQGRVTFTRSQYDNLDHAIRVERYHDMDSDGVDPDDDPQPDDVLIARSDMLFDDRGHVYRTKQYAVNPQTGAAGNALVDDVWYDAAGNKIKDQPAGSQIFIKSVYDGLGRVVKQYRGYDLSETSYADSGSVTGDTILEQTETTYDAAGNVIFVTTRQRLHNATGTGQLTSQSGAQPRARVSYVAMYQDEIGRPIATANYGTNDSVAPNRPDCVPERSGDVLVSSTEYNSAGEPFKSIDPAGREDRLFFDALGRTIKTVQNYVDGIVDVDYQDEDVAVEMTYNADGRLATLTAKNPTTGDQTTRYVYGTALSESAIARSDLLRAEIYPDSDDTADPLSDGADEVYDRVEYRYNRQGERIEKKDQNETVHAYKFDNLGRLIHDRVTSVGTRVDSAALRISTTYDIRGLVEKITIYDNATVGSGSVVNEVVFEYNETGQPSKEYQEHSGAKDANTLYVGYHYDTSASSGAFTKGLRPASVRYPNGRLVHFTYGSPGEMNDALNRLAAINDDNSGTPGNSVAEYTYLGLGTIVVEDYPQPEVKLNYDSAAAGEYAGFDRFGRVVDQLWYDYGASADRDRYTYGYDRASNRLYRENTMASGKDEFYSYDGVNQLQTFDRGDLNAGKTAISGTPVREEDWTLDMTGNWSGYVQKTSGTTDLDQARTHNNVNEVTAIAATTGANWADPVHDKGGNMTTIPKPSSLANGLTATYDAWNRLVEVSDGLTVVGRYSYDGLKRRVKKGLDSQSPGSPDGIDQYVHYFYHGQWQVLETRETTSESDQAENLQPKYQYVWSPRYIDAAVLRDENTDQDSLCDDARLYYLADANFNVTTLVDTGGDAIERYLYSPYGSATVYDGTWMNTRFSSSYANVVLYTGREYDPETGLWQYRNRYYDSDLSRFISRDPIGYLAHTLNLYQYGHGAPTTHTDPSGNLAVCCRRMRTGGIGDRFIDHCQLRNVCVPGEKSSPVWPDRDPDRKMDDGKPCSQASKADIEACLRRNAHSDQPRGGKPTIGNNCQTGTLLRLGKCCLSSTWKPGIVAGDPRGRCLKYVYFYAPGPPTCVEWELPDWQERKECPDPDPPVCPPIDDTSHGGWPIDEAPPGVTYPPVQ